MASPEVGEGASAPASSSAPAPTAASCAEVSAVASEA